MVTVRAGKDDDSKFHCLSPVLGVGFEVSLARQISQPASSCDSERLMWRRPPRPSAKQSDARVERTLLSVAVDVDFDSTRTLFRRGCPISRVLCEKCGFRRNLLRFGSVSQSYVLSHSLPQPPPVTSDLAPLSKLEVVCFLREVISEKLLATPANTKFDIRNTLFFKILRANPLLARFYADLFRRHGANPSLIRDLEASCRKNFRTRSIKPNHRKAQTPWQSSQTPVPVLTSRSTESAATHRRYAMKSSVISISG